jgi:iron(III) transport system substrate-binding protein
MVRSMAFLRSGRLLCVYAGLRTGLRAGLIAAVAALIVTGTPAHAQTAADILTYSGPDRMARLIEGAKKERTLTVYTSATVPDTTAIKTPFEAKYGIKVQSWRGSSENVVQRVLTEARANRFDADFFETDSSVMELMHREGMLAKYFSPELSQLAPGAVPKHGEWFGTRLQLFAVAYNTNLVKREELPKTYKDLLDPRWKGRLGIEAEDSDWFGGVIDDMGGDSNVQLFRDIVAKNGFSVRKGHTLLINLVASGEVPLAVNIHWHQAERLKKDGAPIDWMIFAPGIIRFQAAAVARRAPHPYAAALFAEHYMTEGQKILSGREFLPANTTVKPLPAGMVVKYLDPGTVLDESEKWDKIYRDVFIAREK